MSDIGQNIEVIQCQTAREFLFKIRLSNIEWLPDGWMASPWVFRGVSDSNYTLMPSLYRTGIFDDGYYRDIVDYFDKNDVWQQSSFKNISIDDKRLKLLVCLQALEHENTRGFVQHADRFGLRPMTVEIGAFNPSSPPLISAVISRNTELIQAFALARHHGICSSLLDCTSNPLVAAYFASETRHSCDSENAAEEIAIWAIDTSNEWVRSEISILYPPRGDNSYIRAQSGLFLRAKQLEYKYLSQGEFLPLDNLLPADAIRKITLPKAQAAELQRLLFVEDFHIARLMPSMDNVKNYMDTWHRTRRSILSMEQSNS